VRRTVHHSFDAVVLVVPAHDLAAVRNVRDGSAQHLGIEAHFIDFTAQHEFTRKHGFGDQGQRGLPLVENDLAEVLEDFRKVSGDFVVDGHATQ